MSSRRLARNTLLRWIGPYEPLNHLPSETAFHDSDEETEQNTKD
jgi:hypothetical protein